MLQEIELTKCRFCEWNVTLRFLSSIFCLSQQQFNAKTVTVLDMVKLIYSVCMSLLIFVVSVIHSVYIPQIPVSVFF